MLKSLLPLTALAIAAPLYTAAADGRDEVESRITDPTVGNAGNSDVQEREVMPGRPSHGEGGAGTTQTRQQQQKAGTGRDAGDVILDAVITEAERHILGDYARKNPGAFDRGDHGGPGKKGGKGKGKGKGAKGLPPGIAMNLQRGKPLPPGLRDRYIPADLRAMLPARKGTRLVPAGKDVLLVDTETQIILDVVTGILRGVSG
jgi:hypothetical protein